MNEDIDQLLELAVPYEIESKNFEKRIRVWRNLVIDVIRDYQTLITELKQTPGMTANSHTGKLLSFCSTKKRFASDFLNLMKKSEWEYHNEILEIYLNFLYEINKIEEEFSKLEKV